MALLLNTIHIGLTISDPRLLMALLLQLSLLVPQEILMDPLLKNLMAHPLRNLMGHHHLRIPMVPPRSRMDLLLENPMDLLHKGNLRTLTALLKCPTPSLDKKLD